MDTGTGKGTGKGTGMAQHVNESLVWVRVRDHGMGTGMVIQFRTRAWVRVRVLQVCRLGLPWSSIDIWVDFPSISE